MREGPVGDQGDGLYSSGRGGTGNIAGAPTTLHGPAHDEDVVPETATRIAKEESHHIGRGGAGNERHVHQEKKAPHESLLDKAKELLKGKKDADK